MTVKKEVVQKIFDGLVEAHEFVVSPEGYSTGATIHHVADDGTIVKIPAEKFWDLAPKAEKDAGGGQFRDIGAEFYDGRLLFSRSWTENAE